MNRYAIIQHSGVEVLVYFDEIDRHYHVSFPGNGARGYTLEGAIHTAHAHWVASGRTKEYSLFIPTTWKQVSISEFCVHPKISLMGNEETGIRSAHCEICHAQMTRRPDLVDPTQYTWEEVEL